MGASGFVQREGETFASMLARVKREAEEAVEAEHAARDD